MANVVTGKIGRSAYFDRKKWKDAAGNNEFPVLISAIAKLNPQNTYYMIGKSDLSRIDDDTYKYWFPHGNILDCWETFNSKTDDPTTFISEKLKDIKINYGVIHGGMCSLSIPNKIYCLNRKLGGITNELRKPIMSLVNYVSPITYYLNESGIDWLTITSDGRYMPLQARDIINPEKISLGVREGIVEIERMKSYEDQVTMIKHKVELRYATTESQYLLDKKLQHRPNMKKTQKFGVFFHEYDDKRRIKEIERFVFNNFNADELVVYGKWDPEKYTGNQFKGPISFDSLQEILPTVKYTFCYPIIKGDISGKWVEAVANGIIPFFHHTYDEDRLLVKYHKIPEFLYITSPEELIDKVEFFEKRSDGYSKMRSMLRNAVIRQDFMNGGHINYMINRAVEDMKKM